jgi:hypothetical protein
MFWEATTKQKNLLVSSYYYPRGMIREFAKADMAKVLRMFMDLYDESKPFAPRIIQFEKESESLRKKYDDGTWKSLYC